ncbi:MAG: UDP-N-acetylmuramoyl-L-alanine--D-glutamate ligase, partial [Actinomycetota bacterium]|nr:UDP-N-acetylmuramoyl-L-alanine--D-glutamate ligase [Actinomycetota bacterium]
MTDAERVLVVGLGLTGEAVARRAVTGGTVTVIEDRPDGPGVAERAARLEALGVKVVGAPGAEELARLVKAAELVVPSPGIPEAHPVYGLAERAGIPILSEIELAATAARERSLPLVAVTGTNGKTTVTTLIAEILTASGMNALAAGNIGRPLIDAVHDAVDVVVAEVSSFQLRFTRHFRPRVAVFLNAAHDHLDWHPSFDAYVAAKAKIFANQADDDLLVYNLDDEAVARAAEAAPARRLGFSLTQPLVVPVTDLPRRAPHDVANALAASAAALDLGAPAEAVALVLRSFAGLPHRTTPVGQTRGVTFVDDSKASNPHAALAAISGCDPVVLVAGGRNKGLDLSVLASQAGRIRAVV